MAKTSEKNTDKKSEKKQQVDIILVEPENPGNIGAVARAMKNFGYNNLVLVNPCKIDDDALKRAKHAKDILVKAKVAKFENLNYDYLVGTTSKLGNDYNIPRCPMLPEELNIAFSKITGAKIGILFGREGKGLYNSEIEKCDFLVTIPTDKEYPALNISHSVAIILYELSKRSDERIGTNIKPISKKEKEILITLIDQKLDGIKFATVQKKKTQQTIWKKVIGKSMLTKREAQALMGFFRKI